MVKLNVIGRPAKATRAHFISSVSGGPIFKGRATDPPDYCCGACGQVLVQGMHAKQFIDASRGFESAGATVRLMKLGFADHLVSRTITIPDEDLTLMSVAGPLVITCGACGASSEMVTPNMIFDEAPTLLEFLESTERQQR